MNGLVRTHRNQAFEASKGNDGEIALWASSRWVYHDVYGLLPLDVWRAHSHHCLNVRAAEALLEGIECHTLV